MCLIQIKRLIFAWLLLCGSTAASSQNVADSFRAVLKTSQPYAEKIKTYIAYGDKIGVQRFDDAIRIGNEGLKLAERNNDLHSVALIKRQIGEAWYFRGDYNAAARFLYESVNLFEKAGEKRALAQSYNALARLYRKTRDLSRSMENYEKAMKIYRNIKDSSGMAIIYNESGVVFEYEGKYDKAVEYYTASLDIDRRMNDAGGVCYALSNLAGVYTLQNKFEDAEKYLMQALTLRKVMKDSFALALNFSDLGSSYLSHKNFEKAGLYIDTSNRIADKMGYPELKSSNYEMLSKIAEMQGDFRAAFDLSKKKSAIKDSLFTIEKTTQIEELNTRYETEKKEGKIKEQENQIALRNILMIVAVILVLLGSLLVYAQYRRTQLRQHAKVQADILKQQELAATAVLEAEEAERSRIASDLHDGVGQIMSAAKMNLSAYENQVTFNTAEQKQSFEKIISLVDAGCKEVRTVSHNMMPNALLKNSLAEAIGEFTGKLDNNSLKVHLYTEGFDKSFNSNIETVLYRVIQECVNNVIKHSGADTVDISLIKEPTEITCTIEDNGKGFELTDAGINEGIGLKNIRTRIEYLKGSVDFKSAPGMGTLVALHIPSP